MAACRMSDNLEKHIPVLLREVIANLVTTADGIYVDATFGRGSHSQAILDQLNPQGRLIAFDKDPEAVAYARQHFAHDARFSILHASYAELENSLRSLDLVGKVQGILFDLGVSSPQLDNPARGFAFSKAGKLDMRMDTTRGEDAASWIARIDETELANVLFQYGEEKFSRRIARAIVAARAEKPITTTDQLAAIIDGAVPFRQPGKHPATRSFQAIRIVINQELVELEQALAQALRVLQPRGRLAVISFHSLEDRIVKQFIQQHEKGQDLPRGLPIKAREFKAQLKSLGKAIKPDLQETKQNPRARSAILRLSEKQS